MDAVTFWFVVGFSFNLPFSPELCEPLTLTYSMDLESN
jgi:hypothetical protein